MDKIAKILQSKNIDPKIKTRNRYEFQAYGNRLAEELSDMKRRSLYIKLAKETPRNLLEMARDYVLKSENATTKGRLFMWKLTELKKEFATRAK